MTLRRVIVIGAGLAGLSAAVTLASGGVGAILVSALASERAQSVLAEGGINASLDTMGENDTPEEHIADTLSGGCFIADEEAVRGLCLHAPEIVRRLIALGVPFNTENGKPVLRPFGGQKKRRTAYAKSSTGKLIMTAMIDEARRYEAAGLIERLPHHVLCDVAADRGALSFVTVRDTHTGVFLKLAGPVILCTGGLCGFFDGHTTGTVQNTGDAAALAFSRGAAFTNLEFLQYHPTTVGISGKRMLVSEAARGEGGRLFVERDGRPWYFMEEKYPTLGNLMSRDVVSREMAFLAGDPAVRGGVFLDMTGIPAGSWEKKLSDLRAEIVSYLHIDPQVTPVPVAPAIHFFMGGLDADQNHRTSLGGLYAAGEAAGIYHGANRLGGNSLLGALYGGTVAARSAQAEAVDIAVEEADGAAVPAPSTPAVTEKVKAALVAGLGIVRTPEGLAAAEEAIESVLASLARGTMDEYRTLLALAMVKSAAARKESRGAHYRADYPASDEAYRARSVAVLERDGKIAVRFESAKGEGK